MRNFLGYRIPSLGRGPGWRHHAALARCGLEAIFQALGGPSSGRRAADEVLSLMQAPGALAAKERRARELRILIPLRRRLRRRLVDRARLIGKQIRPWLMKDRRVVDVGCGNGLVMHLLPRRWDVVLADVERRLSPGVRFPFVPWHPTRGHFLPVRPDVVLLLTVLHHARHPRKVIEAVSRLRPRRIVVIESVLEEPRGRARLARLLRESDFATRIWFATFADWIYNRVLQDEQLVPFNFGRVADWHTLFADAGYACVAEQSLGLDQPLVPEVHWLGVFEPRAQVP
jgi:SAM-dependent methyltransferase